MTIARLSLITLHCADQEALAAFWAELLGGEIVHRTEEVAVVQTERGALCALRVPGYEPPTWPGGATPNHMHLDLVVDDLDAGEAEAIRVGARRAEVQPGPDRWRVLLDPAGHPFCLTTHLPLLPLGPRPEERDEDR
ncbi:VOC family protein [Nocardia iowensis]|uniref:VOC family protein n=1 Tax=Nocardia iowensis TaxID=204891 RepID=A0ABX8RJC9_NOCIO|nr:VOC family protein [Nocardia iowensis]QXN89738.1 VOC family protein [Nocardia iowensis]